MKLEASGWVGFVLCPGPLCPKASGWAGFYLDPKLWVGIKPWQNLWVTLGQGLEGFQIFVLGRVGFFSGVLKTLTACWSQNYCKKKARPKFLQNLFFHAPLDIFSGKPANSAIESVT